MTPFIGYVYEMFNNVDGCYYIGSTVKSLNVRLNEHKQNAKRNPHFKVYQHFNSIGWQHVQIRIIIRDMFNSIEELRQLEHQYLQPCRDDALCLNERAAYQTREERLQYNRNKATHYNNRIINCKYCGAQMKYNSYNVHHRKPCSNKVAFQELPFEQP